MRVFSNLQSDMPSWVLFFSTLLGSLYSPRMKHLLRVLILLASFVLGSSAPSRADLPWQVDKMQVVMGIEPGGRLRVEETIAFNLGHARHHYLTRRIALVPEAGGRRLNIRVHAITDGRGHPWPARVREWKDLLEIRIGNGETFLTGPQDLLLVYDVEGAIRKGRVRDELHWDVTGGPWDGPIVDLTVQVALPPGAAPEMIDAGAWIERLGEAPHAAELKAVDPEHARFILQRGLRVRETMRISLRWPAELLPAPNPVAQIGRGLLRRPWWLLPIAALFVFGARTIAARQRSRLRLAPGSPPRSPIELGLLANGALRPRHLVAAVLDLARRGVLRIEREAAAGTDRRALRFVLRRAGAAGTEGGSMPALAGHEALLLDALLPPSQTVQSMNGDLALRVAAALPAITGAARKKLEAAGELPSACRLRRWRPAAIAFVAALVLGALLAWATGAHFPAALCGIALAAAATALIVAIAIEARSRTPRGRKLSIGAEDRKRMAADGAEQTLFDTYLPAAVATGMAAAWIRDHAAMVRRPHYFPDAGLRDGADRGETEEAGRLFADLDPLSEPIRLAFGVVG